MHRGAWINEGLMHVFAKFAGFSAVAFLAACTPPKPTMSLEEAMRVCRAQVSKPVETQIGVGISGNSNGKIRPSASVSIGVDLTAANNPQKAYEQCVRRNSGEAPTEEF